MGREDGNAWIKRLPWLIIREALVPAVGAAVFAALANGFGFGSLWMIFASMGGAFSGALVLAWTTSSDDAVLKQPTSLESAVSPQHSNFVPMVEGRLDPVLEALPIGVMVADSDQMVIAANSRMRTVFGLPEDPGYPVETLRARRILEGIASVQSSGNSAVFEMTLARGSDAVLCIDIQPAPSGAPDGIALIVTVEDITKARLADEVHRDFVANASHELKTPLAVISGLIDTLQGPAKDDAVATKRFLTRLASQTKRMTGLINGLMSLNRIELNEMVLPQEPVDLAKLIVNTVDAWQPVAEASGGALALEPIEQSVNVLADWDELQQLFGNLIDNAVKYGAAGNHVNVKLRQSEDGEQVGVTVTDFGAGIAREHIPRLTERFYRVDIGRSREQGGTGLGLAICKHIVNRHRGRLEVESRIGEGSQFTVWLPKWVAEGDPEARVFPV